MTSSTRVHLWVLSLAMLTQAVGCTAMRSFALPETLQSRLQSPHSTADDHRAAAELYRQRADELREEAARYAREAESISQLEDTKGYRGAALKATAREREQEAEKMSLVSAEHLRQAETRTTKSSTSDIPQSNR